ncbi:GNAT family N-acetyltransferase [Lactococcus lactis]|uniref:GNAT family N-acetyltransferase n=1 Tax=Lactococcus lactis TaxID=1358 RepID=UPI001CC2F24E|nr:GNAT family N-acetyltransferase [Lactococcus lactis]
MLIRNYESKDLDEVINLFKNTIFEINISDYTLEQVKAWVDVDTELFDDNLGKTYARVISNHEQLVGFGNIDDKGYIDLFYVSADYQRQGVGQKLLNDLEKSSNYTSFMVNSSITTKPFFEKMGYKETKRTVYTCEGKILLTLL